MMWAELVKTAQHKSKRETAMKQAMATQLQGEKDNLSKVERQLNDKQRLLEELKAQEQEWHAKLAEKQKKNEDASEAAQKYMDKIKRER